MPTFEVTDAELSAADVDVVAIPAVAAPSLDEDADEQTAPPAPTLGPGAEQLAAAIDVDLTVECRALRFDGSVGSIARIPTRGAIPASLVLVVGLGKSDDLDAEAVRKAAAALADATSRQRSVATTIPAAADRLEPAGAAQALVEGLSLGAYRFSRYKSKGDEHRLEQVAVHGTATDALRDGVRIGDIHARAAAVARDLVNEPPANKRPPAFADRVRSLVDGTDVDITVLDETALERGGYGGIIAVGKGSEAPPRLVELSYAPDGAERHVALVGKGITFDSGGLSLKSGSGMMTMKMDMGGAAAVVATVKAAAELQLPLRLTGVLALAENMPSATAQRPGDVYTARNGKTVEVLNTDAEGRLVLSDALAHASEREPDVVVDLATLTGAVVVALGNRIGGLLTDHDGLADGLLSASQASGERLWRLPLPDDYRADLKSEVADLKNIGQQGVAGTIIGGLFLKEFVADGIPWAHLDIAGIAWSDKQYGYVRKGGTGAPVRTLLEWLTAGA
ncbi:MAG: leucyl aminopeptidase [Actinomycetota bacterium]|nr:leucyl aminopeptidase [Actinomycetota bacterium]